MSSTGGSEMLSDRDPNGGGGRASRGSNMSGLSRVSGKTASSTSSPNFPALLGRGITSMLRTGTEMGDVGDMVLDNFSGSGTRQHRTQWHGASSLSAASSMSNASSRVARSFSANPSSSSASRYLTASNAPKCGASDNPPAIPNSSSSSSTGTIENRDRNSNRSRSTIHTVQPSFNPSSNRSLTNLRYAQNLRPQNSYAHLAFHRAGSGSSTPNNWSTSSALTDGIGTDSQASYSLEGQRPSTSGDSHPYAKHGHAYNTRAQPSTGQGQLYHGLGHPHNVGQMRFRLPHQPSSQSLKDRRGEGDTFPPFGDMAYDEQLDRVHTSKLQSHRDPLSRNRTDHRPEVFPLPANHKQYIVAEQADSRKFAAGSVSGSSTYLHTSSDALSSDTSAYPIAKDGRSLGMLHSSEELKPKYTSSDPSNFGSSVADSMPVATRDESIESTTDKATSDPNIAAGPGQSKEDRVSGVPASFPENDPDAPIGEPRGNITPSKRTGNVSEHTVTSIGSGVKSSPFVTRAASDHARKSWNEQSFESCTSISDELANPVRPISVKDCKEYPEPTPDLLLQQGKYLVDPGTESNPKEKGAASSDQVGLRLSSQSYLIESETVAMGDTRTKAGVYSPRSAVTGKPLPMYSNQDHFPCFSEDSRATSTSPSSEDTLRNSQATTRLGRGGRVGPVVGVGPRHVPRHSAAGIGSHRNSLVPTRLTDIQEDSVQEDSTADLELSSHRYPSRLRYLPDLKEQPHRGFIPQSVFGTPSSSQASDEDLVNVSRISATSHRGSDTDGSASDAFAQSHGLSLIQRGQVDLSDEPTGDVGLRHSYSMEAPHVSQRLNTGSLPKPAAVGEVQRQMASLTGVEDVERTALSMHSVAAIGLSEMHRACSPELVAEIGGLTVPSLGLTQGFSESCSSLMESRKRDESPELLIKEEADRTHPTQKHSSAGLGSVPDIAHMVSEDVVYELEKKGKRNSKENEKNVSGRIDVGVAAIGASGVNAVEKLEMGSGTTPTQTYHSTAQLANPRVASPPISPRRSDAVNIQGSRNSTDLTLPSSRSFHGHHDTDSLASSQLAPPTPSRRRSSAIHAQDTRYPSDFTLSSRRSLRPPTSTSEAGETHPRNTDANGISVASINTAVDTFLPHSEAPGHPPHSRSSHHRNRPSEASSTTVFSTAQTATASTSRLPTDNNAQIPTNHLNSFGRISNHPHEVGERYPTSALTPPTAIFRDQLCVSDTSEDDLHDISREARDPLCKRILTACDNTYYKLALRASRGQSSPDCFEASATRVVQDGVREAKDLKASTEAKSDKQHQHKTWWQKSSHLIRQLTTRKPSSNNNNV